MIPMPRRDSPTWSESEPLTCVMVIPEAPDVKTFSFRPASGATFHFKAGQFITLELPVPGGPVWRTYTISSSPITNAYVTVTVKAQPGSIGTRWMLDHLQPGMVLNARGPGGEFHLPSEPDAKYLFISAGSGVTPMMSMTTTLFERGEQPDICFIQCANRPVDLIFRKKLEYMASRLAGLALHFVVMGNDPYEVWTGYRGTLNQLMLGIICGDYLEREVYCCGPEGFMANVREILNSLHFDMTRYHQESFGVVPVPQPESFDDRVPDEAVQASVIFALSGVTRVCAETDTVLQVAKGAAIRMPSGCNFGLCGTCKVKKTSGEVHMVHNGGISDDDIAAGYILSCCSRPIGTVTIEA
jgi:ferredoxin-NADP reductase